MIQRVLREIGLTQNEIKVYLALLDLGESKSGEILKKAGLNSGKIYEILDSLQKKGFVSFKIKNKIKYFNPADPKRVLDYLEDKKEILKEQEEEYNKILPELLKKISSTKSKTSIEIYTGIKGMKTAYQKEFNFPKSKILRVLGVLPSEKYSSFVSDYFENIHRPKRNKKDFIIKKILSETARKERLRHEKRARVKYLPYGSLLVITIIGDLTLLGIPLEGEVITISIENKEIAQSFIEQFEFLWKIAKI